MSEPFLDLLHRHALCEKPQGSEWPLDKEGKPTTYIGKGKSEGDLRRFRFRDETTGEIIVVEQFY